MKASQAAAGRASAARRGPVPAGRVVIAAAVLCLVAAGCLMWWRHGEAVFTSLVASALAWCF